MSGCCLSGSTMARFAFVGARDRDELAQPSQALVDASLAGDVDFVARTLSSGAADVNYIGTVSLRVKCIETAALRDDEADELEIHYRDFVTDVTPLFAAAHSGHLDIARKLLSAGAYVNQELFRGFATTAAAREGHCVLLDMLLKAGASQSACEDALLEACRCDQPKAAELLICSEMTGHDVAQHALVSASCRGFVDVVATLIKNGVNKDCVDRVLLRSAKPVLHANVDCTPLIAAIVCRQVNVVKYLLEVGVKTDCHVRLGAWSWDVFSGEELRVGACMGEPYNEVWSAVEYYEATGQILNLLLKHQASSLESQVQGRTLLCHAILCQNLEAVNVLLSAGADIEFPIRTNKGHVSCPLHLAARTGCLEILKRLILNGCEVDSRTEAGDTALMVAAKADQADCFLELILAGADLALVNENGESALKLAKRSAFGSNVVNILRQVIVSGKPVNSSNLEVFSVLHFVAGIGSPELLQIVLQRSRADIDRHDGSGLTPVLVAAGSGHSEAFRLLINARADLGTKSRTGQTVVSLLQDHSPPGVRARFEEILLDSVLAGTLTGSSGFKPLHFAARTGNKNAIIGLLKMKFDIDSLDDNDHSPLMVAAKEGQTDACTLLLTNGADCKLVNPRGETALSLARKSNKCKAAEGVIFDNLARSHVLHGEELLKHTREGKGSPHLKVVRMVRTGFLTWGKSRRRNVQCKEAISGASEGFLKNWRKVSNGVMFRVVSEMRREVHFEVASQEEMELWVRGINLVVGDCDVADDLDLK